MAGETTQEDDDVVNRKDSSALVSSSSCQEEDDPPETNINIDRGSHLILKDQRPETTTTSTTWFAEKPDEPKCLEPKCSIKKVPVRRKLSEGVQDFSTVSFGKTDVCIVDDHHAADVPHQGAAEEEISSSLNNIISSGYGQAYNIGPEEDEEPAVVRKFNAEYVVEELTQSKIQSPRSSASKQPLATIQSKHRRPSLFDIEAADQMLLSLGASHFFSSRRRFHNYLLDDLNEEGDISSKCTKRDVYEHYEFGGVIGEGGSGTVWEARRRIFAGWSQERLAEGKVAVKRIPKANIHRALRRTQVNNITHAGGLESGFNTINNTLGGDNNYINQEAVVGNNLHHLNSSSSSSSNINFSPAPLLHSEYNTLRGLRSSMRSGINPLPAAAATESSRNTTTAAQHVNSIIGNNNKRRASLASSSVVSRGRCVRPSSNRPPSSTCSVLHPRDLSRNRSPGGPHHLDSSLNSSGCGAGGGPRRARLKHVRSLCLTSPPTSTTMFSVRALAGDEGANNIDQGSTLTNHMIRRDEDDESSKKSFVL